MVCAQHRNSPRKRDAQTPLGFWNTDGSPNLSQMTRCNNNQQKRTCQIVADHWVKLKKAKIRISNLILKKAWKWRWYQL